MRARAGRRRRSAAPAIGVATDNNSNTGVHGAGQRRAGQHRQLCRSTTDFFETMGIELVAGRWFDAQPAGGRHRPCPSRRADAAAAGARRRAASISSSTSSPRARHGLPQSRRRGRQDRSASGLVDERIWPGAGHRSSASSGTRASARSASRSIRSCSTNQQLRPYPHARPLRRRSRAAVRGRVERVWKRLAPEVPFDAEFSEDIIAELYEAEERARRSSPASPCSR